MLSIASRDPPSPYHSHARQMPIRQHHHSHSHSSASYNPLPSPSSSSTNSSTTGPSLLVGSMPPGGEGGSQPPPRCCEAGAPVSATSSQSAAVSQALEIARESPDGAQDPTVSQILEQALAGIWAKVQAQPDSYVMSREEFAVFNFFQHRFAGDKTAVMARKRYWDHATAA